MKRISLGWQILIGLALGILIGGIFYGNPGVTTSLKPVGDIFLRLIKMIVVPIVMSSIVIGVAGVGNMKTLGKIGGKTLLYFEIVTTIAIAVGLLAANLFQPGAGVEKSHLAKTDISSYVSTADTTKHQSMIDTIVNIVPANPIQALANGDMLAIIFFSVIFGLGVAAIGDKGTPIVTFFSGVADVMFYVTNQVMKVAPIGVFALIGVTVSVFGISSLMPLIKLVAVVYGSMIFFILVILGLIAKMVNFNIFKLLSYLKDELILGYTTASSEAVLPKIMEKMEKLGCPKAITSFVIPAGYSFNLDGSTLYQSIAALFIAQIYGIHLSLSQQITLMLVLMVTSKGIAGVPGVSFVVLLATLGSVGLPVQGLALIAGIDRILDMARTVVNIIGNSLAAIVITKWEGHKIKERLQDKIA